MLNKKALFISGLLGIVAVGSSIGAYAALRGTDDPVDTIANFEVPGPGNDSNQTRLATDKSPYPAHLIGGDAVDPALGVPDPGVESSPTFEDWLRWKAGELDSLDEIVLTDDPVSINDESGELSLGVPAPGFEDSVDEMIVLVEPREPRSDDGRVNDLDERYN